MKSKRTLEGELIVDHRAGAGVPGLPRMFEAPTITCSHCQVVVVVNPSRTRPRSFCPACDRYICDACEFRRHQPGYVHQSFSEFADKYLNAAALGKELPKWPNE